MNTSTKQHNNFRTCYLNNNGTKWVHKDVFGNKDKLTLQVSDGSTITRTVEYWEQFGNFATARISIKGKKVKVFPDTILDASILK